MRLVLSGRNWGKIGKTQEAVKQFLLGLDEDLVFKKTGIADYVVVPDENTEPSATALRSSNKVITIKILVQIIDKKSRLEKTSQKKTDIKLFEKQNSTGKKKQQLTSVKKKLASRKKTSSKKKLVVARDKNNGDIGHWKFRLVPGQNWRFYLFDTPEEKFNWGTSGPTKEIFMAHVLEGARLRNQPIEFMANPNNADIVVVGDYTSNATRDVVRARFPDFVIASVIMRRATGVSFWQHATAGYFDKLASFGLQQDRQGKIVPL